MRRERHFKTRARFDAVLASGGIQDVDLCFIRDTREIYTHGEFYSRGCDNAMFFGGGFNAASLPYRKNTMVSFRGHWWISLRDTHDAPYPILTARDGRKLRKRDGGYLLASQTMSPDWMMLF